jgi:hypothetical protein
MIWVFEMQLLNDEINNRDMKIYNITIKTITITPFAIKD